MGNFRPGRRMRWPIAALGAAAVITVPSCSGSGGGSQTSLSDKQTIVFAVQGGVGGGLGSEGANTAKEIAAFEKKHPNIRIKVHPISGDSADQAEAQIRPLLVAGNSTPDVIDADMTWVGPYARAGWIAPVDGPASPAGTTLFPGQAAGEKYRGKTYARPWFITVEGLYYRTDLVPSPPRTPAEVVTAAKAALRSDPSLKMGFAWEGSKYEGQLTAFMSIVGGFGGTLDVKNLNTPQVLAALQYLHDLVHTDKITPEAVTGWTEQDADNAFSTGQAPFGLNWPYQLQENEADGSAVKGRTAWIPFPSSTGHPIAPVGGSALMINSRSRHKAAANEFINFLMGCPQQLSRALDAGDPPSVRECYTDELYAKAPYFRQEQAVFDAAAGRPVLANYKEQAAAIELMISQVLTNQKSPQDALKQAAQTLAPLRSGA